MTGWKWIDNEPRWIPSRTRTDIKQAATVCVAGGIAMSSSMTWRTDAATGNEAAPTASLRSETAIDNRLNTLREVALTLLREVESLRVSQPVTAKRSVRLYEEVQRFEIDLIRSALSRTAGNQTRAAQLLGVKITTLNTKIKRYKIEPIGYDANVNDANVDDVVQAEENAA
jgi:DNA-binding protein Fis